MKAEKICVVVGAAPVIEEDFLLYINKWKQEKRELLVIAADAGYRLWQSEKIRKLAEADIVLGDFDSLKTVPDHPYLIRHPAEKDDTDMLLAVKTGLEKGFRLFALFGGLGNRFDHSFANVQTLSYLAKQNAKGILFGDTMHMTVVRTGSLIFPETFTGYVSVFALSGEARVTIKGLKYELTKGMLTHNFPLGVSNEFIGRESLLRVDAGEVLVMWQRENKWLPITGEMFPGI